MTMQDLLTVNGAIDHGNGHYSVKSIDTTNSWTIQIIKDAINQDTGTFWEWMVDGQYFSRDDWAAKFLEERITEKNTGERVINRARGQVPDICGIGGAFCRVKGRGYFTMLCSECPVAEQMQAERDGLKLRYAVGE